MLQLNCCNSFTIIECVHRFMDIYFSSSEVKKVIEDLAEDAVYDATAFEPANTQTPAPEAVAGTSTGQSDTASLFKRRRSVGCIPKHSGIILLISELSFWHQRPETQQQKPL